MDIPTADAQTIDLAAIEAQQATLGPSSSQGRVPQPTSSILYRQSSKWICVSTTLSANSSTTWPRHGAV